MTLVDTNVILDLATNDPIWVEWSRAQLDAAASRGPLFVSDIVFAEVCVGFSEMGVVETMLESMGVRIEATPRQALFLAAKAYERYKKRGGRRSSILPDFFIGAHAAILERPLLTRDVRRYRTDFPGVRLIDPSSSP
ncbi:MAG: type II toxin-antitoxin system VapC family toxin [Salinarimonas sp.]